MNEIELRNLMYTAHLPGKGTFVIRYPRGKGVIADWHKPMQELPVGKGVCLKEGTDLAVLSLGPLGNQAAKAVAELETEGYSVAHYNMLFMKPLDAELLKSVASKFKQVITVEDGVVSGGFGSAVINFFNDNGFCVRVHKIGVPDKFVEHGTQEELYALCGMDKNGVLDVARRILKETNH
jgi:1-deoxy-D-xylulose-5-phosphate synthase